MKRIFKILGLIFALLSGLSCCRQPAVTPPPQEDLLYQVECFSLTYPDSAARILDTLDMTVLSEKEKAHCCLLKIKTLRLLDHYDASVDSMMQIIEKQFVGSDDKYYEAKTYWLLAGKALADGSGKHVMLEEMLNALQSVEQCHHVDERLVHFSPIPTDEQTIIDRLKYDIHNQLGTVYGMCGYWRNAYDHLKLADDYYAEHHDYKSRIKTAYQLGFIYLGLQEYDSCLLCYQNGLKAAEALNDTAKCAEYHHNFAYHYLYLFDNQTEKSEEEKQQWLRMSVSENLKSLSLGGNRLSDVYESLASGYYWLQQYDSTIYYALKVIEIDDPNDPYNNLDRAYLHLQRSYQFLGDYSNAAHYADLYIKTLDRDKGKEQKAIAEVNDEYEKQLEIQQLQNAQQLKRMRLYLLIAALVIVLLVVVLLFYRHQKESEVKNLRLNQEKQQLQKDYDDKERHSIEALRMRMQTIYKERNDDLYDRLVTEFNAVYPDALSNFSSTHPELTETECAICLLSCFSFRVKEIAYILDLRENTVSKARLAIKKKTGVEDLAELMKSFIG
jgi:DNA-binding CsgD family transcriptional regulator